MAQVHTSSVGHRYDDSPFSASTTSNWVARVGGLPPYVRAVARGILKSGSAHDLSGAIQMAIGVMSNWVASPHTTPKTKAKAAAAIAWWEAAKAAAHAGADKRMADLVAELEMETRSGEWEPLLRAVGEWGSSGPAAATTPGDGSGAATLLPVGPTKKQSDEIDAELKTHRFVGQNFQECAECGKPILDPVHTKAKPGQPIMPVPREINPLISPQTNPYGAASAIGVEGIGLARHAGGDHLHVSSGHLAGHLTLARQRNERHIASVEDPLTDALRAHFADQRRVTINRLLSKNNGKRLLKRATELLRADEPPPPDSPYVIPPDPESGAPASVNPSMIFLPSYWADKTAQVLAPHMSTATALAANSVNQQLGTDANTSLGPLQDLVNQRAAQMAQYITGVTAKDLSAALQQGVANGEGMPAIAKRVNDVFDQADIARAKQIAQTAVVGAYNEGAHTYASNLPDGTVGSKRWLAHKDTRTRPTHRLADGQEQQLDQPYWVGGAPMMYPGDQAAPIGEWINCRCSQAFLPPGLSHSSIADAAAAYVAGLKASPPPAKTPYATV